MNGTQEPNHEDANSGDLSVAVLGGGISGLAAAHRLNQLLPNAKVTVFDANERSGGVVQTKQVDGFLIEQAADNFLYNAQLPWAGDLADSIGMADELIPPNAENRRALVAKNGQTLPVPEGFYLMAAGDLGETWKSPLLSYAGKWRLWAERFVKPKNNVEESLTEFATRRVGKETFQRLVQPLVSGIYSANPDRLSVAAALPAFTEMERKHGSLTAGLKQKAAETQRTAGARYQMFRAPRDGMASFVDRLKSSIVADFHTATVTSAQPNDDQNSWTVKTQTDIHQFNAVVCALPAFAAASVLTDANSQLASALGNIEHVGVAVASLGYRRDQIRHPLDAFGLVIPAIENRNCIAISFASNKYPNRAPQDHALLRIFMGGAMRPDLIELDDDALVSTAIQEAKDLLQVDGNPVLTRLARWKPITPQYNLGHQERIATIDTQTANTNGLAIAGCALRGVGVPQCIRSGQVAAEKIATDLLPS